MLSCFAAGIAAITYASLPSSPYFYKVANGTWIQIYPTNRSTGIRNVFLNGNTLTYTVTDNSDADEDSTVGTIKDPVAAGYMRSGITVSGSCFIATAAYGSPMAPQVQILRKFRDLFLLTNPTGEALVRLYYDYSPPVADFITKHADIRKLVRWSLLPLVGISWVVLKIGPLYSLAVMVLLGFGLIGLARLNGGFAVGRHVQILGDQAGGTGDHATYGKGELETVAHLRY